MSEDIMERLYFLVEAESRAVRSGATFYRGVD
jgi:hypothetical protein